MVLALTFYTSHLKTQNLGDCNVNHLHLSPKHFFFHEYPNFDQILYFMWLWHTRVWQGSFSCGFLIDNLSLTLNISPTPPTFISNHTPYIPPHPHLNIPLLIHEVIKHLTHFFANCCIWSLCNESYPLQRFSSKINAYWVPGEPFLRQNFYGQGPKAILQLFLYQRDIDV